MRPAFSEAEAPKILDMQKLRMDQLWRRYRKTHGVEGISDMTFLRSLNIMGYTPDEAITELNLLKMEQWK